MNDREVKRYEMFNRVVKFGQDNTDDFSASSKAAELFARLKAAVAQMDDARTLPQVDQATARAVLLDALRIDLENIARTASEIANEMPGFADRFALPTNLSPSAVLTAAGQMLDELGQAGVSAQFAGYELPETFVADLADDLDELESSRDAIDPCSDVRESSSPVTLSAAIHASLQIVGKLNAIMCNKYTRQPEKLRAWKNACQIERAAQRETVTEPANDCA